MTKSVLTKAVSQEDDKTWTFQCPGVRGSKCGTVGDPDTAAVPFRSTGWPTKAIAIARGDEHFGDHKLGAAITEARTAAAAAGEDFDQAAFIDAHELNPASTLEDFRARHNLTVNDDGSVSLEEL